MVGLNLKIWIYKIIHIIKRHWFLHLLPVGIELSFLEMKYYFSTLRYTLNNSTAMKTKLILFFIVIVIASCKTAKQGCPGANYQGQKFKASKFTWD